MESKQTAMRSLKTARGQIDGILKMIDDDRYCIDISNQILAVIALLKKANLDILNGHIEGCLHHALTHKEDMEQKLDEIQAIITKLGK